MIPNDTIPPQIVVIKRNFIVREGPAHNATAGINFTSPPPIRLKAKRAARIIKINTAIPIEYRI